VSSKHCIGPVIRALRLSQGKGLNMMADDLGIEASNLSRFERSCGGGLRMPNQLYPIAEYLGVTVPTLFMLLEISWTDPTLLKRYARIQGIAMRLNRVVSGAVNG
jgi:transcriptional regulator with XRE-family HTH domain